MLYPIIRLLIYVADIFNFYVKRFISSYLGLLLFLVSVVAITARSADLHQF